jgi:hypothetical protein
MIIEILFIMVMFLWFLTILPLPQVQPYTGAGGVLAFVAVLLLGLAIYAPALGGGRLAGHIAFAMSRVFG